MSATKMRKTLSIWLVSSAFALAAPLGAQWVNYPKAGVPLAKDGKPNLAAPAPKTADGKPDLSGIWEADGQTYFFDLAAGLKPEDVVPTPWARAVQQERVDRNHGDDPLGRCLPHGVPRVNTNGLFPFKIIQNSGLIVILYEQLGLFRQNFIAG